MRAGVRALLLGAALALVAPAPGLACEARGDRDPASQRLGVVFWSREPPSALLQVLVERAIELALAREIERDVELGRLRHPRVDV